MILAGYLLYFLLASGRKHSGSGWRVLLLIGIRSILWMYLYMVDRALDRVTTPLLLAEFVLLSGWVIQEIQIITESEESHRLQTVKIAGVIFLLALCGITGTVINVKDTGKEYQMRQEVDERWNALTAYCMSHRENYYTVDVYSSTSYKGVPYSDRLFEASDNQYRNYDICGGWIAKSPLMLNKQKKAGFNRLEEALIDGSALFIAAPDTDMQWIGDYYKDRGSTIEAAIIDEITMTDGTVVYQVYRIKRKENRL